MKKYLLLVAALPIVLGGCTSMVYEGKYDYVQGWRRGRIFDITGNVDKYTPISVDCRKESAGSLGKKFVTVKYYSLKYWHTGIFPAAPETSFAVKNDVYVNILDCGLLIARPQPR